MHAESGNSRQDCVAGRTRQSHKLNPAAFFCPNHSRHSSHHNATASADGVTPSDIPHHAKSLE
jgi:hypothetical protein